MSRDEAWQVLSGAHTGILTTLRRDGVPVTLPVWFVVIDRRIYVSGPAQTKKFGRIQRDPRVSFLVESGSRWAELCGVQATGRATIVDDPAKLEQVREAMHEKYHRYRTDRAAMPEATRAHYDTGVTTIEIVPDERLLNWDNARLGIDCP
ncbi:MAG: TIGR03618 family F420-dependent PPOX class oxidoreductase [Acidobacteriota bacterium]|nr:TIGR03618 family F420-dependent PPOX class oxidoreductase [Acidobacteriota bacterium]